MLKIALIVGSTRQGRFADRPAQWIVDGAAARTDFAIEVLDLRDHPLPFLDSAIPPAYAKGAYADPAVAAWSARIAAADGYIVTAAEYNRSMTAVLKNAFDHLYPEWGNKPIGFVGYGGLGGARAVEQLRLVAVELQMAPIRHAVHIGLEPFLGVMREGRTLESYEHLNQSRAALFDQLAWWADALKAARERTAAA